MTLPIPVVPPRTGRRYLRTPVPIHFPVSEEVPESARHWKARTLLAESVQHALGDHVLVSSDQFLYWEATDPRRKLAPDVAFRVGEPSEVLDSWKTWERGAPHVGVEIVSGSDASELRFEEKLERYRSAGVLEIVRYDWEDHERPIRIWDLVEGDLGERDLTDPEALKCDTLGWYWCQREDPELGLLLRLARNRDGTDLVLTPLEAERAATAAERAATAAERGAKDAALARIAELEAALAQKRP
jgi:Uma2 family endonuclease